jgi:DNA-binding FadR family transcriptional regulator
MELQVSRGSLREGVRALSTMGILETRQGAGTFVTRMEPSALLSAMEFWVSLQDGERVHQVHTVREHSKRKLRQWRRSVSTTSN